MPRLFVKINGEKPARFVLQHRIDTHHVTTLEVIQDGLGCHGQEGLVRAFATSHTRLFANAFNPFVGTGGGVTFLARPLVLPEYRIYVFATSKKSEKQRDFL